MSQMMVEKINAMRAERGIQPLQVREDLVRCAYTRSEELKKSFEHTRPDGASYISVFDSLGYARPRVAGENIAYNSFQYAKKDSVLGYFWVKDKETAVKDFFEQWCNSPTHLANMMDPSYNYFGFGLSSNYLEMGCGSRTWGAQLFAQ